MKLRNKKTGEILEYDNIFFYKLTCNGNEKFKPNAQTICELNEDWEDYEEPKTPLYYVIFDTGEIECFNQGDFPEVEKLEKQFGNYFETREEAEKVVEKLKAWKRLKDKGFRFTHYHCGTEIIRFKVPDSFFPENNTITEETEKDMELLFGGEE